MKISLLPFLLWSSLLQNLAKGLCIHIHCILTTAGHTPGNFVPDDMTVCVLRMKYWMLYSTSHLEIDCSSICKWLVECSTQYFMHRWSCCLVASDKVHAASCMVCPTEHVLNRKLASRSRSRVNYEPIWHNGSLNMYVFDENLSLNLKIMRSTLHVHVGTSM